MANGTFIELPPGNEEIKDWRGSISKPEPEGVIMTLLMAPPRGLVMVRFTVSGLLMAKLPGRCEIASTIGVESS